MESKRHIVFFSGGLGSFATAERVIAKEGKENVHLLFTDTLIEDEDLYRFIIEASEHLYGKTYEDKAKDVEDIPATSSTSMEERKKYLDSLGRKVSNFFPNVHWINNGQDVWDVFAEKRFLGNSRLAHCSHVLKQDMARAYIEKNFEEEDTLYLGIDWTEQHRVASPKRNWLPYIVEFPMTEEPLETNIHHVKRLEELGIKVPRLYSMGFAHNNCGGFCVRGGQGHFINLLEQRPDLYKYHETKELEIRELIGKDVSILRRQRKGVKYRLTLKQLREDYEADRKEEIDLLDIGGCGCFVTDDKTKEGGDNL